MKIDAEDKALLYRHLGDFRDGFREYANSFLRDNFGDRWADEVQNILSFQYRDSRRGEVELKMPIEKCLDFGQFKSFALRYRELLLSTIGNKAHSLPTWLDDITEIRNKVAHFDEIEVDEANKARINMRQIARLLNITALEEQLNRKPQVIARPRASRRSDLASETDRLVEAAVRQFPKLSFKVNSGNEHRLMHSGLVGSLWIRPRYHGYRVATTGEVARIDGQIERLVGACTGVEEGKGYKYWYLEDTNTIDKIIAALGQI